MGLICDIGKKNEVLGKVEKWKREGGVEVGRVEMWKLPREGKKEKENSWRLRFVRPWSEPRPQG